MTSAVKPGIVLGNLVCLHAVNLSVFLYGDSSYEYSLIFGALAAGLGWIVLTGIAAIGLAVLSASYRPAQAGLNPYLWGFVISIPVLAVAFIPVALMMWSWDLR